MWVLRADDAAGGESTRFAAGAVFAFSTDQLRSSVLIDSAAL